MNPVRSGRRRRSHNRRRPFANVLLRAKARVRTARAFPLAPVNRWRCFSLRECPYEGAEEHRFCSGRNRFRMVDRSKLTGPKARHRSRASRRPLGWCCRHKRAGAARFARVDCALYATFAAVRLLARSAVPDPGFRPAVETIAKHLARLCARTAVRLQCCHCEHCEAALAVSASRSRPCRLMDPRSAEACRLPLQRRPESGPEPLPMVWSRPASVHRSRPACRRAVPERAAHPRSQFSTKVRAAQHFAPSDGPASSLDLPVNPARVLVATL